MDNWNARKRTCPDLFVYPILETDVVPLFVTKEIILVFNMNVQRKNL